MEWLKRIFGGGGGRPSGGDPDGLYFYIQPDRCDEVIRIRVHRYNDLSTDDNDVLWAHKHVRGIKCFTPVEVDLYFTPERKLARHTITGGKLVDQAAWEAWQGAERGE